MVIENPQESIENLQEGTPNPQEGTPNPQEGTPNPQEGTPNPQEGVENPQEGVGNPPEGREQQNLVPAEQNNRENSLSDLERLEMERKLIQPDEDKNLPKIDTSLTKENVMEDSVTEKNVVTPKSPPSLNQERGVLSKSGEVLPPEAFPSSQSVEKIKRSPSFLSRNWVQILMSQGTINEDVGELFDTNFDSIINDIMKGSFLNRDIKKNEESILSNQEEKISEPLSKISPVGGWVLEGPKNISEGTLDRSKLTLKYDAKLAKETPETLGDTTQFNLGSEIFNKLRLGIHRQTGQSFIISSYRGSAVRLGPILDSQVNYSAQPVILRGISDTWPGLFEGVTDEKGYDFAGHDSLSSFTSGKVAMPRGLTPQRPKSGGSPAASHLTSGGSLRQNSNIDQSGRRLEGDSSRGRANPLFSNELNRSVKAEGFKRQDSGTAEELEEHLLSKEFGSEAYRLLKEYCETNDFSLQKAFLSSVMSYKETINQEVEKYPYTLVPDGDKGGSLYQKYKSAAKNQQKEGEKNVSEAVMSTTKTRKLYRDLILNMPLSSPKKVENFLKADFQGIDPYDYYLLDTDGKPRFKEPIRTKIESVDSHLLIDPLSYSEAKKLLGKPDISFEEYATYINEGCDNFIKNNVNEDQVKVQNTCKKLKRMVTFLEVSKGGYQKDHLNVAPTRSVMGPVFAPTRNLWPELDPAMVIIIPKDANRIRGYPTNVLLPFEQRFVDVIVTRQSGTTNL